MRKLLKHTYLRHSRLMVMYKSIEPQETQKLFYPSYVGYRRLLKRGGIANTSLIIDALVEVELTLT